MSIDVIIYFFVANICIIYIISLTNFIGGGRGNGARKRWWRERGGEGHRLRDPLHMERGSQCTNYVLRIWRTMTVEQSRWMATLTRSRLCHGDITVGCSNCVAEVQPWVACIRDVGDDADGGLLQIKHIYLNHFIIFIFINSEQRIHPKVTKI